MTNSDLSPPSPHSTEKLCSSCFTAIPNSAIVCKQCRNFQGKWWFLRLVGLGLPWIVAGLTVASYLTTIVFRSPLEPLNEITTIIEDMTAEKLAILVVNNNALPMVFVTLSDSFCVGNNLNFHSVQDVHFMNGDPFIPSNASRVLYFDISKSYLKNMVSDDHVKNCTLNYDLKVGRQEFGNTVVIRREDIERLQTGIVHHDGI